MPLSLTDTRVEVLMHLLYVKPAGLAARELAFHFDPPMPTRSAQRWLAGLVAAGLLARKGRGHSTRYLAPTERRGRKPRSAPPRRVLPQSATEAASDSPPSISSPAGNRVTPPRAGATPAASSAPAPVTPAPAPSHATGTAPATGSAPASAPAPTPARAHTPASAPARPTQARADATAAPVQATPVRADAKAAPAPTAATPPAAPVAPARSPAASGLPQVTTLSPNRVAELLQPLIRSLVDYQTVPDRVREDVQMRTTQRLRPGESLGELVAVATATLDRMTMDDAVRAGIAPAAFTEWRQIYWPTMVVGAPPAPEPPTALPPTPSITADRARHLIGYVPDVVRERITPAALDAWLAKHAQMALRGAETLDDWTALMRAKLSYLHMEEAVALNIRPEKYRLWRRAVWPRA